MTALADSSVLTKVLSTEYTFFLYFFFFSDNCNYWSLFRMCVKMKVFFFKFLMRGFHLEKISNKLAFGTVTQNYVLNQQKKATMFWTWGTLEIHNGCQRPKNQCL